VISLNEDVLKILLSELVPEKKLLNQKFPRITWHDAMNFYGSDKPDIRFEMKFADLSEDTKNCGFQVFSDVVANGGVVKALVVSGGAAFSRKEIDELTELAKVYGAKGLAYASLNIDGLKSPIGKFFEPGIFESLLQKIGAKTGDIVFFTADKFVTACTALGNVRLSCADKLKLRDPDVLALLWVTDFPLFEYSAEDNKLVASHHPFTAPKDEMIDLLDTAPEKVLAKAYDIVMNGSEIGGGSIRIHSPAVQEKIFKVLGLTGDEIEKRFGHLLEAFSYGAPPHGGLAWGLDRIIMLLRNEPNIREVIAFPKDSKAKDWMTGAPSSLPPETLKEMNIKSIAEL
jgi:aspartyl-tRNA synthetase